MFARLLSLIPTLLIGALLMSMVNSVALANPEGQGDEWRPNPEKMHEHIKARLDKLANRLEIKASQQPAWDTFAKAVEALADVPANRPGENADAAAVAHFRADMAADMAKKLSVIADATDKLEAALTENQRKVLNEEVRHMGHGGHRCGPHNGRGKNEQGGHDNEGGPAD
jgi:hypothetical protein